MKSQYIPIAFCLCWFAFCLLAGNTLHATETSVEAKVAFEAGTKYFEQGKYIDAADSFRKAYKLKPTWRILYNLGQSECAAKRYGRAIEAFESFLIQGGDDVIEEQKDEVTTEIRRIQLLVGLVTVDAPNGAELFVDGVSRGSTTANTSLRVAAGLHYFQVKQGDETIFEDHLKIAGGVTSHIDAAVVAPKENETENKKVVLAIKTPVKPAHRWSTQKAKKLKIGGIVAGSVGFVAMGVGIGFFAKGTNDAREAEDLAPWDTARTEYNETTLPRNKAMTITGLTLGAIGIATGTVLFVVGQKKSKERLAFVPTASGVGITF
ncbi:MAG: tetratricopeptide repeat protein [Deltaproteobacteria bacterium]|nr:tetratricopeptide repeat protein [Deltaproteobacteria bacterium]